MRLPGLSDRLDQEFRIVTSEEDLVEWAVTAENRQHFETEFLSHKTGMVMASSDEVDTICTSVFVTEAIVRQLIDRPGTLLVTHHHFDYHEDQRGLQPIPSEWLRALRDAHVSLYVAHAHLDTHPVYGTSRALAELVGATIDSAFFDYYGEPVALVSHIPRINTEAFAFTVQERLRRPYVTLSLQWPCVDRIAVVAGGGDTPELLQQAFELGCDTLLTGTIENRWQVPSVQDANREFHRLNERLKLNLIGGTHFGTERPAMIKLLDLFRPWGVAAEYLEDEGLLRAE